MTSIKTKSTPIQLSFSERHRGALLLLTVLSIFIGLLYKITALPHFYYLLFLVSLIIAPVIVFSDASKSIYLQKTEFTSLIIIIVLSVIFSMNLIYHGIFYFLGFVPIISFIIAMGIYRADFSSKIWDYINIMFCVYVLSSVFLLNIETNSVLGSGSRNHITTVVLFLIGMAWVHRPRENSHKSQLSSISTMMGIGTLVLTTGRSGLIVGAGLVVLLLYEYNSFRKQILFTLVTFAIILLITFLTGYMPTSFSILVERGGVQSSRWEIWWKLLSQLEVRHLFFGYTPTWETEVMDGISPHNSFIRLLRAYGLIGPVLGVLGFMYIVKNHLSENFGLVILSALLFFRVMFDAHLMAPQTFLGILFWMLLLYQK